MSWEAVQGDTAYKRTGFWASHAIPIGRGQNVAHVWTDSRGIEVEIRKAADGWRVYVTDLRDHRDHDSRKAFATFEEAHDAAPAAVRWALAQRVDANRYGQGGGE